MLDGALHLLRQPLALLVILAAALAVGLPGRASAMAALVTAFAAGLWAGARLEPAGWHAGAAALYVTFAGLALALDRRAQAMPGMFALVTASGLAVALGANLTVATWPELAGAGGLACLLLAGSGAAAAGLRRRWPGSGPGRGRGLRAVMARVAGAWLAAIGLLVATLALQGRGV